MCGREKSSRDRKASALAKNIPVCSALGPTLCFETVVFVVEGPGSDQKALLFRWGVDLSVSRKYICMRLRSCDGVTCEGFKIDKEGRSGSYGRFCVSKSEFLELV